MPTRKHYHARYKPHYKHSKKLFTLDMILLAIIIALLVFNGYYFFFRGVPSDKVIVNISVEQETVKSGGEVTFVIDYINKEEVVLENASLSFQLPPHFYARQFFPPVNEQKTVFHLGDLKPNDKGQLKISGRILGGVDEEQKIYTTLDYQVAGWKDWGQKNSSFAYEIEGSLLNLEIVFPEQINIDEPFDFTINYNNDSFDEFKGIILVPNLPNNFKITETDPELTDGRWLIPGLGQGGQETIKAKGILSGYSKDPLCLVSYISFNTGDLKQSEVCQTFEVESASINFSQTVNGYTDYTAELGEELDYVIKYQNGSKENIRNVVLKIVLKGEIYDLASLEVIEGKKENNQITWPKTGLLQPSQSGELKFKVKLKQAIKDPSKDLTAIIKSQASYSILNQPAELIGPDLLTRINTGLTLKILARYYSAEGEQLGVGPLPPVAGLTTKYWILLQPRTSTNTVKNIIISGILPANVRWVGEVMSSLGEGIRYFPETRRIIWSIEELTPLTEEEQKYLGGGFEVELTPTKGQIGQEAVLLQNITISGWDEFTKQEIPSHLPDITTDLKQDNKAAGKGVVAEF